MSSVIALRKGRIVKFPIEALPAPKTNFWHNSFYYKRNYSAYQLLQKISHYNNPIANLEDDDLKRLLGYAMIAELVVYQGANTESEYFQLINDIAPVLDDYVIEERRQLEAQNGAQG